MEKKELNELMSITSEECAELTQVCMKIVRFGIDNNNYKNKREWLVEEAGDVLCMLELLTENNLVTWDQLKERADYKKNKLKRWSNIANV